jgi:hypothetical protein
MNCEEYREAIAGDPSFDGGAGHVSECSSCQAYRHEMIALDENIRRALSLNVPELNMPELPEIETSNVVSLASRRRFAPPAWFAMAATVVVAALIGIRFVGVENRSLAEEVLAHLDGEPHALVITDVEVSDERLGSVVPANIGSMDRSAGLITYAQSCEINGRDVPHLVIQGERGPVTILLMPEEKISAALPLEGDTVHGVILPVGDGSVAIIGVREERLDLIEKRVLKSVTWST